VRINHLERHVELIESTLSDKQFVCRDPEEYVKAFERIGPPSIERDTHREETLAEFAKLISKQIEVALRSEKMVREFIGVIEIARQQDPPETAARYDTAKRRLLGAWLKVAEPPVKQLNRWRGECEAAGFDVSTWDDLAIDANTHRQTHDRLAAMEG
jgi:hypothetical protein